MALTNRTKIKVGSVEEWAWVSEAPVEVGQTLSVIFRTKGGFETTLPLDNKLPAQDVNQIESDQRTIHLEPPPPPGPAPDHTGLTGPAWLKTNKGDAYPVRIQHCSGTRAVLEDPLEVRLNLNQTHATLQLATWTTTLASPLTDEVRREVQWQVVYNSQAGEEEPVYTVVDSGVLQVVEKPFATGLSHERLLGFFPMLARRVPERQTSFKEQIDAAESELTGRIRADLRKLDRTEDDVEGFYFLSAHAYLTASLILYGDLDTFAQADQLRQLYLTAYDEASKRILIDLNDDGVADDEIATSGGFDLETTSSFLGPQRPRKFKVDGTI